MIQIDKQLYLELTRNGKLQVLRLQSNWKRLTGHPRLLHHMSALSDDELLHLGNVFFDCPAGWPKVLYWDTNVNYRRFVISAHGPDDIEGTSFSDIEDVIQALKAASGPTPAVTYVDHTGRVHDVSITSRPT